MSEALAEAISLLEKNDFNQALSHCQQWAKREPTNNEPFHIQGLVHAQKGEFKKAVSAFLKALELSPHEAVIHNNISNAYKKLGRLDLAQRHLFQALRIDPNYSEGYSNLGSLFYTLGEIDDAITHLEKALRLNPNYWEAHFNLAHCYVKKDQYLPAITHYEKVIQALPKHPVAIHNLGMAYFAASQFEKAIPCLEEAHHMEPNNSHIVYQLAHAHLDLGHIEKAKEAFEKTLSLSPQHPETIHNLAVLSLRTGDKDKAKHFFEKAYQLEPNNQTAKYMIQALDEIQETEETPSQYISDLFDQYADYYNKHMKTQLNYKVPELMREAMSTYLSSGTKAGYLLDLGCGTGLCGIYFRDLAEYMIGVDLSKEMLQQAKRLGPYDSFTRQDIRDGIPGQNAHHFDYILAADVLVYHGHLDQIFQHIQSALKPKGFFLFTIELGEQANYQILSSGRYQHSLSYIELVCQQNQLRILDKKPVVLREDKGEPVNGYLLITQPDLP